MTKLYFKALLGLLLLTPVVGYSIDSTPKPETLCVFGDSLSDPGNLAAIYNNSTFPQPPFFGNRISNGYVMAEVFADSLGLTLDGFYTELSTHGSYSGTNFAIAGARYRDTGTGIDLGSQVSTYLGFSAPCGHSKGLSLIIAGGNDIREAIDYAIVGNPEWAAQVISDAVTAFFFEVMQPLINAGHRNFLVANVPDLGRVPEIISKDKTYAALGYINAGDLINIATTLTTSFNIALQTAVANLREGNSNISIVEFDIFTKLNRYLTRMEKRDHVIDVGMITGYDTDVTAAGQLEITNMTCAGSNPDCEFSNLRKLNQRVFWDGLHPSARTHKFFGYRLKAYYQCVSRDMSGGRCR
ncbi:MAG: SGNH/GDSL hydrolase family protein [Gammaproteobacteria bacterium]|nr:SGNH/GDSL hydrolase family protein [Gammaproteobacteria bacterium]